MTTQKQMYICTQAKSTKPTFYFKFALRDLLKSAFFSLKRKGTITYSVKIIIRQDYGLLCTKIMICQTTPRKTQNLLISQCDAASEFHNNAIM